MLDKLTFYSLCVLIFVLPVTKAGVEIFSTLAVILFLAQAVKRYFCQRSITDLSTQGFILGAPRAISVPVLLYVLVGFATLFTTCDLKLTLSGFIGKLLQATLLFFAAASALTTRRRIKVFLVLFAASALILCLDSFWQLRFGWDLFRHNGLTEGRVRASLNHPNDLGAYLIVVLPLMFMMLYWVWLRFLEKKSTRNVLLLLVGLLTAGVVFSILVLTYSRSAWIGLLIGMGLWALLQRSWKVFALFFFVLIFVMAPMVVSKRSLPEGDISFRRHSVVAGVVQPSQPSGICGRFLDILDRSLNTSDRLNYWKDAIRIIKDRPVLGFGLNTYTKVIRVYSPQFPNYAHNSYLQVAAEMGVIGLVILLWALIAPLVFALRRINAFTDPFWRGILGAVAAGYIGLLMESALDTTFYSVQLSMIVWVLMSLLVVLPLSKEEK